VRQHAHMWLLLRSSPDKRPQVQRGGVHSEAGITLQSYAGEVPQLERESHCVQQQMRQEDRGRQGGAAE